VKGSQRPLPKSVLAGRNGRSETGLQVRIMCTSPNDVALYVGPIVAGYGKY